MDAYRLKIRIGGHEFDAEGPAEVVQRQFAAFRELVMAWSPRRQGEAPTLPERAAANGPSQRPGHAELPLARIMKQDGRIVSLTARAGSLEDEILLVMLGQRRLRQNDSMTGSEIIEGLRQTGRTVRRVDYQLDKMTAAGQTITVGVGRARRYRLTNQGFARAQDIARALLERVV